MEVFRNRLLDRQAIHDELIHRALNDTGPWLTERLEREFMKEGFSRATSGRVQAACLRSHSSSNTVLLTAGRDGTG